MHQKSCGVGPDLPSPVSCLLAWEDESLMAETDLDFELAVLVETGDCFAKAFNSATMKVKYTGVSVSANSCKEDRIQAHDFPASTPYKGNGPTFRNHSVKAEFTAPAGANSKHVLTPAKMDQFSSGQRAGAAHGGEAVSDEARKSGSIRSAGSGSGVCTQSSSVVVKREVHTPNGNEVSPEVARNRDTAKGVPVGVGSAASNRAQNFLDASDKPCGSLPASVAAEEDLTFKLFVDIRVGEDKPSAALSLQEKCINTLLADPLRDSTSQMAGCSSLKRRGNQGLSEGLAVKRSRVETESGLSLEGRKDSVEQRGKLVLNSDHQGGDRHMGVRMDNGTLDGDQNFGCIVGAEVKYENRTTVAEAHKEDSPLSASLVVDSVKEANIEGSEWLNEQSINGVRKSTDLTGLLDDLSADLEDSEDLDGDEVEFGSDFCAEGPSKDITVSGQKPDIKIENFPAGSHISELEMDDLLSRSNLRTAAVVNDADRGTPPERGIASRDSVDHTAGPSPYLNGNLEITRQDLHPSGVITASLGSPRLTQGETIAKPLAMHSTEVEQIQRAGDTAIKREEVHALNTKENLPPEVVLLDSDSDDEDGGLIMFDQLDGNFLPGRAVKLEDESIKEVPERDVGNNENNHPVLSSITTSGSFRYTVPPVGHSLGGVTTYHSQPAEQPSASGTPSYGQVRGPGAIPEIRVSPACQPASQRLHSIDCRTSPTDRILDESAVRSGTMLPSKLQAGNTALGEVEQGQQLLSKPGFISAHNTMNVRLSLVNALANALSDTARFRVLPATKFGQFPASSSGWLSQNDPTQRPTSSVKRASSSQFENPPTSTAVVPYLDEAAQKVQISPLSTYTSQKTSGNNMECPGNLHSQNGLGSSTTLLADRRVEDVTHTPMPYQEDATGNRIATPSSEDRLPAGVGVHPLQERRSADQNHTSLQPSSSRTPGPRKSEPGVFDSNGLGPQKSEWNNQLLVVKPSYDSAVSTPRVEVARTLDYYHKCVDQAKAKLVEIRQESARRALASNEPVKEGPGRGLDCRPDIVAYNHLKRENLFVNRGITVGDVPGVEVGDRFTFRHQMAVVGLHRLPNVGIDYGYLPPENTITATAIVCMPKAGYVDDVDDGHKLLYTGQGGRSARNQTAPFVQEQKPEKGNRALIENYNRKLPVRVIRGHSKFMTSSNNVTLGYTYDGLYTISEWEYAPGIGGHNVYKFHLERLQDQPPIPPCFEGCSAHTWNNNDNALAAQPLQVVEPDIEQMDVKQICGLREYLDPAERGISSQSASQTGGLL